MSNRIWLFIFLFLVFWEQVFASDKNQGYVIAYDVDHDVCGHFLRLFNTDIEKYGYVNTDEHEEFSKIQWEEMNVQDDENKFLTWNESLAVFDVNNDGKDEYVVKDASELHGTLSDSLYVFKEKPTDGQEIVQNLQASWKNESSLATKIFDETGGFYNLKSLKKYTRKEWIGGRFSVYPMQYKNNIYISINERSGIASDPSSHLIGLTKWHVIAKYSPDYQLRDICYFQKAGRK